jgi:hypothetical protein
MSIIEKRQPRGQFPETAQENVVAALPSYGGQRFFNTTRKSISYN